jgi:thiosulfate dehydrogenase [quinone] large subunit
MSNSTSPHPELWRYTWVKLWVLVLLRVVIGWHFMYEGIAKLLNPYWTSAGFLLESKGVASGVFHWIAADPTALKAVDLLNTWGLIAIGLALMAGFLMRTAALAGMLLLVLYYVCNPPFFGFTYSAPSEGSYLIINKNVVEFFALWVLILFPTSKIIGLDGLLFRKKSA